MTCRVPGHGGSGLRVSRRRLAVRRLWRVAVRRRAVRGLAVRGLRRVAGRRRGGHRVAPAVGRDTGAQRTTGPPGRGRRDRPRLPRTPSWGPAGADPIRVDSTRAGGLRRLPRRPPTRGVEARLRHRSSPQTVVPAPVKSFVPRDRLAFVHPPSGRTRGTCSCASSPPGVLSATLTGSDADAHRPLLRRPDRPGAGPGA
jgi:hypothetical protein